MGLFFLVTATTYLFVPHTGILLAKQNASIQHQISNNLIFKIGHQKLQLKIKRNENNSTIVQNSLAKSKIFIPKRPCDENGWDGIEEANAIWFL